MKPRGINRIERFYEDNRQGLYTYALSLSHDPETAEDAIQAVFFNLLRGNRLPRGLRPYVFRSVRNAIIDDRRREQSKTNKATLLSTETGINPHPVRDRAVRQCLNRLADGDRETIILKIYGGLTFKEIAGIDGTSANTVASRYRRGLEKMRTMLKGEA